MASKSQSKKPSKKGLAAKKKIAKKSNSQPARSNFQKASKSTSKKSAATKAVQNRGKQKASTSPVELELLNPLGKKFTCYNCGTKFYDLNKPEKICPKCGADQMAKPALKSRQAALRASDYEYDEEDPIRKYPEDEEDDAFLEEDEPASEVDEDAVEEESD